MNFLTALLLGAVQGLTEFFPVSSSGHVAILAQLLGIKNEGGILFDICLHIGTMLAVLVIFRKPVRRLLLSIADIAKDIVFNIRLALDGKKRTEGRAYRRLLTDNYRSLAAMLVMAFIPTALVGAFLESLSEKASAGLLFPGMGLLVTGVVLLVVDNVKEGETALRDMPIRRALYIGAAQGLSVLPGLSRSGMTICSSLLAGMSRKMAVHFSFLLMIPTMIGALIYEIGFKSADGSFSATVLIYGLAGAAVSAFVGYLTIRKMIVMVQKKQLKGFAVYCFVIGIIAMIAYFALGERA